MKEVLRVSISSDDEGCGHVRVYMVDSYGALTDVTERYNVAVIDDEETGATGLALLKNKCPSSSPET